MIDDCAGHLQKQNMAALEDVVSQFYMQQHSGAKQDLSVKFKHGGLSPQMAARRQRIFQDFGRLVTEYRIPQWTVRLLLDGLRSDTIVDEVKSEKDLLLYCVRVASSIGVLCVFLYDMDNISEEVLVKATSLGIAFQLTNISRDIITDARIGRTYIPNSWICEKARSREKFVAEICRDQVYANGICRELSLDLIDLAETYYDIGWDGISFLPRHIQGAVASALLIYREIGMKIRIQDVYPGRASVTTREKCVLAGKALYYLIFGIKPKFHALGRAVHTNQSAEALACCTERFATKKAFSQKGSLKGLARLKHILPKLKPTKLHIPNQDDERKNSEIFVTSHEARK